MKKSAILMGVAAILFISCDATKVATVTDDVYASPTEERARARALAEEKAKQEALARQEAKAKEDAIAAESAARQREIENNPYYKDPEYNSEEYYDYEYASRINRFHNPIGVGYYDSYYTNMYTYTGNPAFYGTSIYSGYGWGMPSQQFGVMSFGVSSCWGCGGGMAYGSSFYDPWCGCN